MSARPINSNTGYISCDTKTPSGTCQNTFGGREGETFLRCEARALQNGWVRAKQIMNGHLCPEHKWLDGSS